MTTTWASAWSSPTLPGKTGPVDVGSGEPPGLQERRDQEHAVKASAERLPTGCLQRLHLRHHMAAQREVAAADQLDPRAGPSGGGDQAASGLHGALARGRLSQAARIGQQEAHRGRGEGGL
jgi:hypothetical protein